MELQKRQKAWVLLAVVFSAAMLTGCETMKRGVKDWRSEVSGLNRRMEVYSHDGQLLKVYEGKFDLDVSDSNKVKFDLNGKRYIIYNAIVVVEEK